MPCVTFDISTAVGLNIVCRLGAFHTLMNFLGSVGHLMRGAGLEDDLSLIYGPNTIEHVLSGRNYARAMRAHLLAYAALNNILLKAVFSQEDDENCLLSLLNIHVDNTDINMSELKEVFKMSLNRDIDVDNSQSLDCQSVVSLSLLLEKVKGQLSELSRTSRLWLLYLSYVELVMQLLLAERTSNWELHLFTLHKMLPLFAATGHLHYAKSARLYLQQMQELPVNYPWLYDQFQQGYHSSVCRQVLGWSID